MSIQYSTTLPHPPRLSTTSTGKSHQFSQAQEEYLIDQNSQKVKSSRHLKMSFNAFISDFQARFSLSSKSLVYPIPAAIDKPVELRRPKTLLGNGIIFPKVDQHQPKPTTNSGMNYSTTNLHDDVSCIFSQGIYITKDQYFLTVAAETVDVFYHLFSLFQTLKSFHNDKQRLAGTY